MMGHKPVMNKDRRKVLDLLEFCLEMNPDVSSVFNVFVREVAHDDGTEFDWVTDKQWALWLQDHANTLLKEAKDV